MIEPTRTFLDVIFEIPDGSVEQSAYTYASVMNLATRPNTNMKGFIKMMEVFSNRGIDCANTQFALEQAITDLKQLTSN